MVDQLYKFNLFTILLLPLSGLYWLLYKTRLLAYKAGPLKTETMPVPVIAVGTLTVGGTGKTPLVIRLAQLLKQNGYRPGIVLRGYKGSATDKPIEVEADTDPAEAGDEAVLLAAATGLPVYAASLYGFLAALILILIFLNRIRIEEQLLAEEFQNAYLEYRETTKKLIPFIY